MLVSIINFEYMKQVFLLFICISQLACAQRTDKNQPTMSNKHQYYQKNQPNKIVLPDSIWKQVLSPAVYQIAREKGTERPFSSPFETSTEIGTYYCAACGNALFKSDTKFDSGCGWPSFFEPISKAAIIYTPAHTHGMDRTEVQCGKCKAHLGHVFEDGPKPTGLRYCINGVVLDFEKK